MITIKPDFGVLILFPFNHLKFCSILLCVGHKLLLKNMISSEVAKIENLPYY